MKKKVFLVDVIPTDTSPEKMKSRMDELENLITTYWWLTIVKKYQRKAIPDYKTYVWAGKLEEIKNQMKIEWCELLIVWNTLKPQQIFNINENLRSINAQAWDRIDLILKIFEAHAKSTEARLQIELAAIKHMWPRIFRMWMDLSRQWGGIWTRWKWETNIQIMKRHIRESEKKIIKKLEDHKKTRKLHRQSRKNKNLDTVGIVGYTNAWKTSILNKMTKKQSKPENKLFATLWTTVGKLWIQKDDFSGKEILMNDTIGFIQDLPPQLIDCFSSTLEDSIFSNILLHVVDSSDSRIKEKIWVVDDILEDIEANQERIYVFNKIDKIDNNQLQNLKKEFKHLDPVFISAENKIWLEQLKQKIIELI